MQIPKTDDTGEEIAALIETLHRTGHRLEELTAGEVDTVADREGRTFVLRLAQEQLRHSEAARQAAILNALPAHIAMLDARGVIVSTNEAWRQFARENSLNGPENAVGVNYLGICDSADGRFSSEAAAAAAGIRAVLDQKSSSFSLEYPCHSPVAERWYQMIVTPLVAGKANGAVVMHLDITAKKQSQNDLSLSEARFRQLAENIRDVFFLRDIHSDRMIYVSPAYEEIWGRSCESLYANPKSWNDATHPDDLADILVKRRNGLLTGKFQFEYRVVRPDGSIRWVESRGFPVYDDDGNIVRIAGIAKDITEKKQAFDKLHQSEREQRELARQLEIERTRLVTAQRVAKVGSWETDLSTYSVIWSEETHRIHGTAPDTFQPNHDAFIMLVHPEDRTAVDEAFTRSINEHTTSEIDHRLLLPDGALKYIKERWRVEFDQNGKPVRVAGTCQDITEQKDAEFRIGRLNRVYAVLSGINTLIVHASDQAELFHQACQIAVDRGGFRMSMIGLIDKRDRNVVHVASAGKGHELITRIKGILASTEGAPTTMVARAIREKKAVVANDSQNDAQVLFNQQYADAGVRSIAVLPLLIADEAMGVIAFYSEERGFFDAEELKLLTELSGDIAFAVDHIEKKERIDYLAYYDVLTGLANRNLFMERLAQHLRSAAAAGQQLAIFVIDLERFKNINDSLGHAAGDALLRQVAEWLTHNAGDSSLVARLDADHFVAMMPVVSPEGNLSLLVERHMTTLLEYPFRLNDTVFRVSVKVGIAVFPDNGFDAETLFKNGEAALKKAKTGGERYLFYTPSMNEAVAGKLSMENQLRRALDQGEFVLHYQPKTSLATGKLTSAEALIRWNDPRTGLVPPGRFIPLLEETGLIYEVGRWALRQAITDYLRWLSAGLPAVRIAVNVSPLQLRHRGFVGEIQEAIGIDARAPGGLELEITESLIMEDVKHSITTLKGIRDMGVTIAIDDFGTGFSSLSYLAKLPVDTLKIDRSFVVEMTLSPEGLALVSTIINLAHSLKLKVVAEGVEIKEQSRLLRLLSCDEMQGFLFSKPVPVGEFETKFLTPGTVDSQ